jgi:hypothetical protein
MVFPYNRSLPPEVLEDLKRRFNDNGRRGVMVLPSEGMTVYDMQQPSVGRMVHYMARGSADGVFPPVCRVAVITEVDELGTRPEHGIPHVGLCVINPTGLFFHPLADRGGLKYDEGKAPGTWHWPEMVPSPETINILAAGSDVPVRTEPARLRCEQCGTPISPKRDDPHGPAYYEHDDVQLDNDHRPVV